MSTPQHRHHAPRLLRYAPFLRFWLGQTLSLVGSQVTLVALPLTAVLTLRATPFQLGLLGAVQYAPYLLLGLLAGVWVDRLPRRPLLIAADLGRALLLGSIPLAALGGILGMGQLYVVGFLVGTLTVCFDVAYGAFLPALVARDQLVEGNSRLEASRAAAQIAGPGLGGWLVQALTAPLAIGLDALSFLASILSLASIRIVEPPARPRSGRRDLRSEIGEGLRIVLRTPLLLAPAGSSALYSLFTALWEAVYVLYLTDRLGIGPALLGLIYASGSVGALLGALVPGGVVRRLGLGPVILAAALISSAGAALIPLVTHGAIVAPATQIAARFLLGLSDTVFVINVVSVRQAITPPHLQGRVTASVRFLADGPAPLGALLGGLLGGWLGLRPTLVLGALGGLLPFIWLWCSPLRRLRAAPEVAEVRGGAP